MKQSKRGGVSDETIVMIDHKRVFSLGCFLNSCEASTEQRKSIFSALNEVGVCAGRRTPIPDVHIKVMTSEHSRDEFPKIWSLEVGESLLFPYESDVALVRQISHLEVAYDRQFRLSLIGESTRLVRTA